MKNLAVVLLAALPVLGASPPAKTPVESAQTFERKYTATAYITFLSVPIFSRAGVGFGFASSEQRVAGANLSLNLRFLSGSNPARAHGLNRFGFIQEEVRQTGNAAPEVSYLGLMTASAEESLKDAKAALGTASDGDVPFVAAQGLVNPQTVRYSMCHLLLPPSYGTAHVAEVVRRVQSQFSAARALPVQNLSGGTPSATFLWSVWQAMRGSSANFTARFTYNGKNFNLEGKRGSDSKAGDEFRRLGLVSSAQSVLVINCLIRGETSGQTSAFRVWFEDGTPNLLPLRFEFRPKSYLRLVYDAEPEGI